MKIDLFVRFFALFSYKVQMESPARAVSYKGGELDEFFIDEKEIFLFLLKNTYIDKE
ncbi:hypothetical protein [Marinomonas arenicola]|uniref:Uncharacterized protein n=1 Tax=Marinomonas arenicola TaxID=569601 RepID=A0ABU9G4N7_9GAMM